MDGDWCLQKYKEKQDKMKAASMTTGFFRLWRGVYIIIALIASYIAAFELGFLTNKNRDVLKVFDFIVALMALVNIAFSLFFGMEGTTLSGYFPPSYWKKTCYYLADASSMLVAQYHFEALEDDYYKILQCSRFFHLVRVKKFLSQLLRDVRIDYTVAQVIDLSIVMLYWLHYNACVFYAIGVYFKRPKTWFSLFNGEMKGTWSFYVISLYWAVTTFTSVGYGDLHAVAQSEMVEASIYMILSSIYLSYFTSNMVTILTGRRSRLNKYRKKLESTQKFVERNKLYPDLRRQMDEYLKIKYDRELYDLGVDDLNEYILDEFPEAIRAEVSEFLFYSIIENVYLFKHIANELIFQIVSVSKVMYFPAEEDIIVKYQAIKGFYIVVTGEVALLHGLNEITRVYEGAVFGEMGVLLQDFQHFTARSRKLCKLLYLETAALADIIEANSGMEKIIMDNIKEHLNSSEPRIQELYGGKTSGFGCLPIFGKIRSMPSRERSMPARVTVCGTSKGKLIKEQINLPDSIEELYKKGCEMFDYMPQRIENEKGGKITDIKTLRDGDVITFVEGTLIYMGEVPEDYIDDGESGEG